MGQKHPRGLYSLFFTEMWERFSYYGMRALLILYMTRQMLYGDTTAYGIYAAYTALVYATPFIGGIIADQILGYRKAIFLGGVMMAIGMFAMTIESQFFFFTGMAFIIIGNGFFKPNISSMVGKLYEPGDSRRDGGFTIFYMGINLGAFFSPLTCGLVGELFGWHYGFGLAGIGMIAGLINFSLSKKNFADDNGTPPNPALLTKSAFLGLSREMFIYIGTFVAVPLIGILLWNFNLLDHFLPPFVGLVFLALLIMSIRMTKIERERMWVIIVLAFFSITFWAFFEQAGSSITLFTDYNVNRQLFGFTLPTSIFQSVNPLFIILLAPIFSTLWIALSRRNREPNTPVKFAMGLVLLGLGFGAFVLGASLAGDNGMVSMIFLILGYMLHTSGELCLSPVGLSMVTRLAPAKLVSMIMGAWFLSIAMAQFLGGTIAKFTSTERFMETGLQYEAKAKFLGNDTFLIRTYVVNESDTLYSEPLAVTFEVAKGVGEVKVTNDTIFRVYRALKPGAEVRTGLRTPLLDPTGDLVTFDINGQAKYGSYTFENDEFVYNAYELPDSVLQAGVVDTISFRAFETEKQERVTYGEMIITISNEEVFAPVAINTALNVKVPASTAIKKSVSTINVLENFYVADGRELQLEMVSEPEGGYANFGNVMNPFVGPTKTIHIYSNVFFYLFIIALATGVVVFALSPLLNKWQHSDKEGQSE